MVEVQRTNWRDKGEAGNETKKRQRTRELEKTIQTLH